MLVERIDRSNGEIVETMTEQQFVAWAKEYDSEYAEWIIETVENGCPFQTCGFHYAKRMDGQSSYS